VRNFSLALGLFGMVPLGALLTPFLYRP
jgi:hypothetical protein